MERKTCFNIYVCTFFQLIIEYLYQKTTIFLSFQLTEAVDKVNKISGFLSH